jgi:hypothetical protein
MIPNLTVIPIYFIIALASSFLILYMIAPMPKIVVKHPDPSQVKSDLYMDDNGVCYRYKRVQVKCT